MLTTGFPRNGRSYYLDDMSVSPGDVLTDRVDDLKKDRDAAIQAAKDVGKSFLLMKAERDAALAQVAAAQIEMRERAANVASTKHEAAMKWAKQHAIRTDGKTDSLLIHDEIRALEPDPDAQSALQRVIEAERQACADVAHRALYPLGQKSEWTDFDQVNAMSAKSVREAILARGNSKEKEE